MSFCLVALLALGTQLGGRFALVRLADPAEPALQGSDLNTGTLLIVPRFGTECRLLHIDNATWRISDRGVVDCEAALAESKERAQNWPAARVDSIRDGFRKTIGTADGPLWRRATTSPARFSRRWLAVRPPLATLGARGY